MTDLETWLHDNDDLKFNVYVKKHIYTPYEQEEKFSDESTEDLMLSEHYIGDAVLLPNNDVLLGFYYVDPENDEGRGPMYYYKLSESRLVEVSVCGD